MNFSKLKSIKTLLISYSLFISIITAALFGFYLKHSYNSTLEILTNDVLRQANKNIIEKTTNYLIPAIMMAETSSRLVENNVLTLKNSLQLEAYSLSMLKPFPQLSAVFFGDKKGNFIMTKRKNDKTIETKIINIEKNTSTIKTRNLFNQVIDVKQEKKIQFDPRTRPWYKGAKEFEQRYWTDVYMFFTDKKPGITAAYPAFDKFDKFYGVFGIDIRLDKISEFLKIQRFSEKSTIFIINDKNKIVAYPNLKEINQKIIGTTPPSIKDISSPLIKEAFKVKANKLGDKFNFDYQDATYYVSFSKFPEHFGKKWRLVIISPEKDIFPTGNDEQYILYSVLFFVLLFTVLTGTILHKKIFQYIATITYDIKKVASGQYNTPLTTKSSTPEIQGVTTALDKLKESLKENQTN